MYIAYMNPLESSLAQQVLILGMILYTHLGRADEAEERMRHLHALFDGGFALGDDSSSFAAAAAAAATGDGEGGCVEVGFFLSLLLLLYAIGIQTDTIRL